MHDYSSLDNSSINIIILGFFFFFHLLSAGEICQNTHLHGVIRLVLKIHT